MKNPKYTIIIPALNEGRTIRAVIGRIPRDIRKESEVLVIDGGSADDTREEAQKAGARVIIETVRGKGTAIRRGISIAKGEFCVLLDGDGSMDPSDIRRLAETAAGSDFVLGSRFLGSRGG